MSKRPRVPGKRKRPAGKLHFRSNPPANASPAVLLGTELRMSAEIIDCCVCGAKAEHFEVLKWGPEPEVRKLDEPLQNGLTQIDFCASQLLPRLCPEELAEPTLSPTRHALSQFEAASRGSMVRRGSTVRVRQRA